MMIVTGMRMTYVAQLFTDVIDSRMLEMLGLKTTLLQKKLFYIYLYLSIHTTFRSTISMLILSS